MPAPYAANSRTSEAAAVSIEDSSHNLRLRVLDHIRRSGPSGATCAECEIALNMRHQTASARIWELRNAGRIWDSGFERRTRSRRHAVVWRATDEAEATP